MINSIVIIFPVYDTRLVPAMRYPFFYNGYFYSHADQKEQENWIVCAWRSYFHFYHHSWNHHIHPRTKTYGDILSRVSSLKYLKNRVCLIVTQKI